MAETLTPTVKWAQNKNEINLTVELSDVQSPIAEFFDNSLVFKAYGHGARGENYYEVEINFFKPINTEASTFKVVDRYVKFNIAKKETEEEFWPRLVKDNKKPVWLKLDFDLWKSEDDSESELKEEPEEESGEIKKIIFDQRMKANYEKEIESVKEEIWMFFKTAYLFVYNLAQGLAFLYIVVSILIKLAYKGKDTHLEVYEKVSDVLATCQVVACLEIIHPLLGLVRGGPGFPLMQVFGRNLIFFMVLVPETDLHHTPLVTSLFMAWSLVEIVRYPLYALQMITVPPKFLVWLRYTIWIPLYPMGLISEMLVVIYGIPLIDKSQRLSYALPNPLNFSFNFGWYLRAHLLMILIGGSILMKHMYHLRRKKYGPKPKLKSN